MQITIDLIVWASLSLCPGFLIIGLALGAILTRQFQIEKARKIVHIELTIKAREWNEKIVPMLDEGWISEGITPADISGFVDVHLSRRM